MKGFFGIYFKGRGFIRIYQGLFANIKSINLSDTLIGLISMVFLYFLRKLKEFDWCEGPDKTSQRARIVKKTKWLLSISANSLVMLTMSLAMFFIPADPTLTGEVESGLPAWQLPWEFNRTYIQDSHWSSSYITALSLVESFIVLLRQLSYAIKNQLFLCMEATYPYAIKNQRGASKIPP